MATATVTALPDATARLRLIESAMLLFSKSGVEDVSIRDLTSHAGVNLAAVNYHFRSKEALAQTVFEELSKRVNRRRVQELKAVLEEAEQASRRPKLEDIISCFIRPYLDEDESNEGLLLARLILQHRLSPTEMTKDLMKKHFDPMAKKFIAALAVSCPDVPSAEFYWRYSFMVSTVVLTMTDRSKESRLARLSAGKADPTDSPSLHAALLRFLKGGLQAE